MKAPYLLDCYRKEFDAQVVRVKEGVFVILDHSYFYPTGGGQPYDMGTITCNGNTYKVVFVKKEDGEIVHEVSDIGLKEGDNIHGEIDWDRRYILMRYHTAAHILSEVISHATGALITGNQLEVDKARIAAQIVTGIGFLGAGAILHRGYVTKGLTTAAALWVTAAVGMACGTGMFVLAFVLTLMSLILLWVLKPFKMHLDRMIDSENGSRKLRKDEE